MGQALGDSAADLQGACRWVPTAMVNACHTHDMCQTPAYHAPHPEKPMAWMTVSTNWAPKMKKNAMKLKELSALRGTGNSREETGSRGVTWLRGREVRV